MKALNYFPSALKAVSGVLEKHEPEKGDSWLKRGCAEHVSHAQQHLLGWDLPDEEEDHLVHAATRLLMALEIVMRVEQKGQNQESDARRDMLKDLAAWVFDEGRHGAFCDARADASVEEPKASHPRCTCGLRELRERLESEGLA